MAQRWVTEEELNSMQKQYAEGGNVQEENPLMEFYSQLPPELQEKIQMLPPEKQQEVLMQLLAKYNNSQQNVDNSQQFALGGKPKSNYDLVQDSLANFMYSPDGKFFSNRQQYQDYQDFYYPKPVEDNVNQPIVNNYYIKKYKPRFINRFEEGGQTQGIPVEAERNENITVQDGQEPEVEGGYLEQQSHNPVTGQSTYEIPDNDHSETHDNGGVNMELAEGDVINSNKTKIPTDFKVYGKNFKGKTFKDASDYLSKQETKIQDDFAEKVKEGKTDKVSDGALQIMLAKLGKNRNELNELQEQVLESKKQKEANESLKSGLAEYGKVVLEMNKAEHGFNSSLDRYLNYKVTDRPVLKAADGLTASMDKFSKFADKVTSNKNASLQDIMSAYNQSGLGNAPSFNNSSSKTPVSFDYKPKNVTIPKQEIFSTIHSASSKYGVDPSLMLTMADIESSFNPNATSKTGAAGLFQFTKGTGKQYGISGEKRYDLKANTDAGARLLADNQKILIKNGIEPTPVYTYLAHQLGAGGAIELYNNITKGTPISATTMSNMGLNFGKKSAEQYLAETTKKVMSRYDGYATKLQQKDADLSLDAHQIKQQYQLPYQPEEIKSDLYNFGIKGITERLKANTYKPTTSNTQQQSSQFRDGGKIYAEDGYSPKFKEGSKESKQYYNQVVDYYKNYPIENQRYTGTGDISDWQSYMVNTFGKPMIAQFMNRDGLNTNKGKHLFNTDLLNEDQAAEAFKDGRFAYRAPIVVPTTDMNLDDASTMDGDYFTFNNNSRQSSDKIPIEGQRFYTKMLPDVRFKINGDTESYDTEITGENVNTKYSVPFINLKDEQTLLSNSRAKGSLNNVKDKLDKDGKPLDNSLKDSKNKNKTSWMDKLKYGIRESLPYLRNLALMNEDTINPILQQKSYQNPFDNMNTDYSIQSALNDSDRSTLTAMADERGNPSVRSARLAQIAANAIAAKAPLYTQKYNQEQQLQNQKTIGQSQYLNQWEDVNRGLHKDFEHEVLQTREIQRQQKAMAIDNMMNDYLRKQEQNQAIDLSLLETNYDYNPITGKYEFNKEKAERNFAEKKYLAKNSSSSNNSKIIEGADGESYEVITPKSGKPIIRKIEKKYGGKVVKY